MRQAKPHRASSDPAYKANLSFQIDTKFAAQVNSLGEILNDAQHKENIPDFAGIQFTGLRVKRKCDIKRHRKEIAKATSIR